jgi:hypothetical protein
MSRAEKRKWRTTMTGLKVLVAAAMISAISATSALAEPAISEPGAFQAMNPDRDVLNGGELTPAGKMGLELPGGAVNLDAVRRAYDPATGTFLGHDARRQPRR